ISTPAHPHEHLVITPYPRKYVTEWKMKNGKHLVLRPIKPEDENRLHELFKSFSEETMRFRFFQVIREMSHETLTRYCNIDYNREIAIVGEAETDNEKRILGVARLIVQPGRKHGEFAVAVGDQWQGFGLGSKLVDRVIEIGRDLGLDSIYGDILSQNLKMFQLCEKKGFRIEPVDEETTKATLDL
ncbi:MAG: GNAT family N-acetyltransferase, partial [Candidatus Bathyarchaeota archaeon]|nr:GNAT family N-acetyltransferase [Candidatus Bathyarchaeota archaeon]